MSSSNAAAASEFEDAQQRGEVEVRHLARRERHAHRAQTIERCRVVLRVVGAALELRLVLRLALGALGFGERGELIFRQRLQGRAYRTPT